LATDIAEVPIVCVESINVNVGLANVSVVISAKVRLVNNIPPKLPIGILDCNLIIRASLLPEPTDDVDPTQITLS